MAGSNLRRFPASEDYWQRRLEQLEDRVRQIAPSVADSFKSTVADLGQLYDQTIDPTYNVASGANYLIPVGQVNRVTRATITFTVPTGYTRALITATAQSTGVNSTASIGYLFSYVSIDGTAYTFSSGPSAPAGYVSAATSTVTNLVTGLTGGATIPVLSQPYTSGADWALNASNSTTLSATCLFLR